MRAGTLRASQQIRLYSLSEYEPFVKALIKQHKLRAPQSAVEILTKTIYRCLVLQSRPKAQTAPRFTPRVHLNKGLKAVQKLVTYLDRRPSRRSSVSIQSRRLREAIDFAGIGAWLAPTEPMTPVSELLEKLRCIEKDGFDADSKSVLTQLLHAIEHSLSSRAKTTGRPQELLRAVVRGGCVAWRSAKMKPLCSWDQRSKVVRGKLAAFVRDLIRMCAAETSEAALYSALREALRSLSANPSTTRPLRNSPHDPRAQVGRNFGGLSASITPPRKLPP